MTKQPQKEEREGWSLWAAGPRQRTAKLPKEKIPGLEAEIAKFDIPEIPDDELRAFRTPVSAETLSRTIGG